MEQLNRVELLGLVGSVHAHDVGNLTEYVLSVATNYAYKDRFGGAVIETTWHEVRGFSGKVVGGPLSTGDRVYVEGRIRTNRYTDMDGNERIQYFIFANKIKKLPDIDISCQTA